MSKYKRILEQIKERMEHDKKMYTNTSQHFLQKGGENRKSLYSTLYAMDEGKRFQSNFVLHLIESALEKAEAND